MALDTFLNTFAGNPLDRASDRRAKPEWIAEQLASSEALGIAVWNGKPFVEASPKTEGGDGGLQIAYLPAKLVGELAGGAERLLFMGLWKDTAVFAVDLEGPADPAEGPLQGFGAFEDLRAVALKLPATEAAIVATAKQMFEWRRRHQHCAVCGQRSEAQDGGWKRRTAWRSPYGMAGRSWKTSRVGRARRSPTSPPTWPGSSPGGLSTCCSWACGKTPPSSRSTSTAPLIRPTGRWRAWAASTTCGPSR